MTAYELSRRFPIRSLAACGRGRARRRVLRIGAGEGEGNRWPSSALSGTAVANYYLRLVLEAESSPRAAIVLTGDRPPPPGATARLGALQKVCGDQLNAYGTASCARCSGNMPEPAADAVTHRVRGCARRASSQAGRSGARRTARCARGRRCVPGGSLHFNPRSIDEAVKPRPAGRRLFETG